MPEMAVPDDCTLGLLSARAALCSASLDEHAVNVGVAVTQAAAKSHCLLDDSCGALMQYSFMAATMPDPAKTVCSRTHTTANGVLHSRELKSRPGRSLPAVRRDNGRG